jgi:hypothetical protein
MFNENVNSIDSENREWPEIRAEFHKAMAEYWQKKKEGSLKRGYDQIQNHQGNAAERIFLSMKNPKLAEFLEDIDLDGVDDERDVLAAKAMLDQLTPEEWNLLNDTYKQWGERKEAA